MWKKIVLGCFALGLMLLTNLHPGCTISVNGEEIRGLYSYRDAKYCQELAELTAEEVLETLAVGPDIKKKWSLSIIPPMGGKIYATDAILSAYPGVKRADGVYVNGVFLGTVQDGEVLKEKTRTFITSQMPNAAVFGSISGDLEISPVYTRKNSFTNYDDMLLLISGMAPVIYTDEYGRLC